MQQNEFETRRSAQKKALKAVGERPIVKTIDLVEMLLEENPSLPVVLQIGSWQFPIVYVSADGDESILRIGI